ncbi:TraR/DksA family transcriptional regulator [Parelusimicrobium proximum]|uniref:TraR/DksA family transcriptional regulator n=1 Tax=Parelusimicrobium proximum TaxID=3228953 RepID=UPI003D17B517
MKKIVKKTKTTKPAAKKTVKKTVKKAAPKKAVKKAVKKQTPKKVVKKTVKKAAPKKIVKPAKKQISKKTAVKAKAAPKKIVKPAKVVKPAKAAKPKVEVKRVSVASKQINKIPAAVKKAVEKPELLTSAELKEVKAHLEEMRDEAVERLRAQKEAMPETEVGDSIDTASQSLDKEILFELSDNAQVLVDQIESALRKIDKGLYGVCESCRAVIPKKRIKVLPFARYCVNCQSTRESSNY